MILELLIFGIIGQGATIEDVLKTLEKEGYTLDTSPPTTITVTDNRDGTVTIEGPSNDEKRLIALYNALSERRRQVFDNNTEIFKLFNAHGILFDFPDDFKKKVSILEAKNTILRGEIEPLEMEYKALYTRMYPDLKELVK